METKPMKFYPGRKPCLNPTNASKLTSPVLTCTDSVYHLKDVRSQDEIRDSLTLLFRANRGVL